MKTRRWKRRPYPHQFREKSTFWSETRFAPHLTISRTMVPFSAWFETKIFHDLISGMVEFQHLRHQFKKNPPVDVETNVLGRTALPWRFRNPKIVGGCFQLRFSSQDVDVCVLLLLLLRFLLLLLLMIVMMILALIHTLSSSPSSYGSVRAYMHIHMVVCVHTCIW